MSLIDARTTIIIVAVLYALLPIALLWAIAPAKKHFAWWWLAGSFSVALGLLLISGRSFMPVWVTYHAANTLLMSSFVFWHQSLRTMQNKAWSISQLLIWFVLAAVIFILAYENLDDVIRASVIRLILGSLSFGLAYSLWRISHQQVGINIKLIAISFFVMGLSFYLHGSLTTLGTDPSPFGQSWDARALSLFVLLTAIVSHVSFFGLTLDINTQARLERRIERINRQENLRLNQHIGELERQTDLRMAASQLAHELNQPLTAVMAMSEVCIQALDRGHIPLEKINDNLDKAALNVKRASDLLASIRIDSHVETAELDVLHLEELIQTALDLLESPIQTHQIRVDVQLDVMPHPALGHSLYMTQVLTNLMRNAIEAMSASPQRILKVSTKSWGEVCELCIEDTGPVVDDEILNKINQPFNSSKPQGLGIGLLICRTLLARQSYALEMHANPNGGLKAIIRLNTQSAEDSSC
jgi:signal transduction histidine kinase